MTRAEVVAEIARLQALLDRYDAVPEDTFNLGTIVRIASNGNQTKQHLLKTGENTWLYMGGNVENSLPGWIIESIDAQLGYFEVYVLSPDEVPIYVNG